MPRNLPTFDAAVLSRPDTIKAPAATLCLLNETQRGVGGNAIVHPEVLPPLVCHEREKA